MYKLSNKAEDDLNNIWLYSFENWSIKQADKYYSEIKDAVLKLGFNSDLGFSKVIKKRDYFTYRVNSHIIFYTKHNQDIFVVRILHKSMNYDYLLP